MTMATDLTALNTAIAANTDSLAKTAFTAMLAYITDVLALQQADAANIVTANAAIAANTAAIAANPYIAQSSNVGIPSTATPPFSYVPTAGTQDLDPALVITVPGRVSAASTQNNPLLGFVTAGALPNATHAVAYSEQLVAGGGDGGVSPGFTFAAIGTQINFQSIGSLLPLGMTLSSAGLLAGTPTTAGTYWIVIQVSDSSGNSMSQAFSLVVA